MSHQSESYIDVEVVLAEGTQCWRRRLRVAQGTTVEQILATTDLTAIYHELVGQPVSQVGVFGRKVAHQYVMRDGERLELYRPLVADPRQRRRDRAAGEARND